MNLLTWRGLLAAAVLGLTIAALSHADVFVLVGGDRITAKPVLKGKKTFTVQTPYGRLVIPRSKVEKIVHDDGSEELLNPSEVQPARVRLILVVLGKTFWQAWDPKEAVGVDPTLRLEVRLDEEVVATYVDSKQDPQDIPGALVNAFSFAPSEVAIDAGTGAEVQAPEVRPGRIVLKVDIPANLAGTRKIRLAYQVNDGTPVETSWRDVVEATSSVEIRSDGPTFLQVRQDRGRMEFSGFPRRRMKNVESFRVELATQE